MRKQYFGVYGEGDVKVCILKSWPQNEVYGEYGVKIVGSYLTTLISASSPAKITTIGQLAVMIAFQQ